MQCALNEKPRVAAYYSALTNLAYGQKKKGAREKKGLTINSESRKSKTVRPYAAPELEKGGFTDLRHRALGRGGVHLLLMAQPRTMRADQKLAKSQKLILGKAFFKTEALESIFWS